MNAREHLEYLAERRASAPLDSLRSSFYSREGVEATDHAIALGLRAWAVERDSSGLETTIVFGKSPSDAKRRASAPGRLAEEMCGDVTRVLPIASGWDEPMVWPFARA